MKTLNTYVVEYLKSFKKFKSKGKNMTCFIETRCGKSFCESISTSESICNVEVFIKKCLRELSEMSDKYDIIRSDFDFNNRNV